MDFLKKFFESKDTEKSFEAFAKWAKEEGLDIADVSKGQYKRVEELDRKLKKQAEDLKAEYEAKMAEARDAAPGKKGAESAGADGEVEKKLAAYEKKLEALRLENEAAKKQSALNEARSNYLEAGGSPKNAERDVSYLFGKVSGEASFAELLASYKKENPEVFEMKKETISTAADVKGGEAKKEEDEAIAQTRKIMGLK
jgi:hypothetical protein